MCKRRKPIRAILGDISYGIAVVKEYLHQIREGQRSIMATLSEAIQGWRDYASELKSQRDAAVQIAQDAADRASAAAEALAQFQADDAATDAAQLAAQAEADAQAVADALTDFKAQDEPVEDGTEPE